MRRMVRNYSIKNRLKGNKDKLQIIAPNRIKILEFLPNLLAIILFTPAFIHCGSQHT
jgi:hypothetical protein